MAITSAICNSFKTEVLTAVHNFTASSGNTFNLALYTSSATINKSTTAYSSTNEISNTSGSAYSAKGKALTSVTPVLSSDTAVCDFANVSWTSASFTANGCLIFNDTASGDPACCAGLVPSISHKELPLCYSNYSVRCVCCWKFNCKSSTSYSFVSTKCNYTNCWIT